jgi:predicted dehydrogenase
MKLKWGIVGLGKIAKKFIDDLGLVDDVEIVAVASRDLNKAHAIAKEYNIASSYGSYEELFSDDEVDIVYVATPHHLHMEISIQAMNAGKHVLCEKPLAVNHHQVSKMIQASHRNHVFLMEAFWSRFNPCLINIFELIKQGKLGEVNYVNADFCFYRDDGPESRLFNMNLGGGSLLDVGVYPVFLAYSIFGMPIEILSTARLHETGADKQMSAILKFENGLASLSSGFTSKSEMVAKVCGTKASIYISEPWHAAKEFKIVCVEHEEIIRMPTQGNGLVYEIEECKSCINNKQIESKLWSHQDSLNMSSITDEIRRQCGIKYPFET